MSYLKLRTKHKKWNDDLFFGTEEPNFYRQLDASSKVEGVYTFDGSILVLNWGFGSMNLRLIGKRFVCRNMVIYANDDVSKLINTSKTIKKEPEPEPEPVKAPEPEPVKAPDLSQSKLLNLSQSKLLNLSQSKLLNLSQSKLLNLSQSKLLNLSQSKLLNLSQSKLLNLSQSNKLLKIRRKNQMNQW